MKAARTVVIGLGNPILTDDSVGLKVARAVREHIDLHGAPEGLENPPDIREVYAGGIRLMDAMTGYDRACIVDAMKTGRFRPGAVVELDRHELGGALNLLCSHDTSFPAALSLGSMLDLHLPAEIRIWGIEVSDATTFGEELTESVRPAVPIAARAVLGSLCSTASGEQP